MQTYHPEYLSWSRCYQAVGGGLFIACLLILLAWVNLKNLALLSVAFVPTVTAEVSLMVAYRRKFAETKQAWAEAHPAGLSTPLTAAQPSLNRCPLCGETIPLERGLSVGLREHYKIKHTEIYRWRQRVKLVVGLIAIASLTFIVLTEQFGQTFSLLSILGMIILIIAIAFYGDRREKRLKRTWQEQHQTQVST